MMYHIRGNKQRSNTVKVSKFQFKEIRLYQ